MPSTAMATTTAPKPVSEYEFLNCDKSWPNSSIETDDDDIPLKSIRNMPSTGNLNKNNPILPKQRDGGDLQPFYNVPVPATLSPIKCAPSIWLTPEKNFDEKSRDTIQRNNNIPQPTSLWSPGMVIEPDPCFFVTPENNQVTTGFQNKPMKDVLFDEKEFTSNFFQDHTGKEKLTVRFDLSSASSGDDTSVGNFELDIGSPITLKGSEVSVDSTSPVWKTFSPAKSYNPGIYSDDSFFHGSSPKMETTVTSNTLDTSKASSISATTFGSQENSKSVRPKRINSHARNLHHKTQTSDPKDSSKYLRSPHSQYDKNPPVSLVVREAKNKYVSTDYSFPFVEAAGGSDMEHVFTRPEYNSTLQVRSELDSLRQQEVDVKTAVQQTLYRSEQKRTEINERAAVLTNCRDDQFNNLVNLDTSVESLCDRIVRMRTANIVKRRKQPKSKKSTKDLHRAADLQEFFSADLQHDDPDLSLPGVTQHSIHLTSAPDLVAFDLYRHNRVWQNIRDTL